MGKCPLYTLVGGNETLLLTDLILIHFEQARQTGAPGLIRNANGQFVSQRAGKKNRKNKVSLHYNTAAHVFALFVSHCCHQLTIRRRMRERVNYIPAEHFAGFNANKQQSQAEKRPFCVSLHSCAQCHFSLVSVGHFSVLNFFFFLSLPESQPKMGFHFCTTIDRHFKQKETLNSHL